MATYYDECKAIARELTGAHTTFTFDHIIREPETQLSAGGIDGEQYRTGTEAGGGYINSVHMDYTDNTTWHRYLALHGETVPDATHVYALNFWRPLSATAHDNPLAICDARTVAPEDVADAIDEDVAVLMLTEVDYQTGRRFASRGYSTLSHNTLD